MLNETIKCMFHLTLVLFQLIDILHNPKIQQLWAFPLNYLLQRMDLTIFYLFPDHPSKAFRGHKKQSRKPSPENRIGRKKEESQAARVSLWGIIYWHVFRNGNWKGGPVPWRGLKPKGLEESLHRVPRSSRDHLGPHRFGVSPGLPTGLQGLESHSQLLQKALDQNQRGVLVSCFQLDHDPIYIEKKLRSLSNQFDGPWVAF